MKSNTILWFDTDVLNVIQNRDKHYRRFKGSGKKIGKGNFNFVKLLFSKISNNKKKNFYEEKIAENKNNLKKLSRILKSLSMHSIG